MENNNNNNIGKSGATANKGVNTPKSGPTNKSNKIAKIKEFFKNPKSWPKKKKIIVLCSLIGIVVAIACAIAIPIAVNNSKNKETVISNRIDDLLPEDKTKADLIVNNVNLSNKKVVLNKDFATEISLKEESKLNYDIVGIEVYTHEPVTYSNASNSSVNEDLKKLEKDKDYTFTIENTKKANLKVFASSFKSKLVLDISLMSSFDAFVNYDSYSVDSDNNYHDIKYSLKEGKVLPTGTVATYKYKDTTKTDPEYFSFKKIGEYPVTLELTCDGYNKYNKTATLTINRTSESCLMTFNPNGGVMSGGSEYCYTDKFSQIKDYIDGRVAVHNDKKFKGWSEDGSTLVNDTKTIDKDINLTALWDTYNVSLTAVNGTIESGKETLTNVNVIHSDEIKATPNDHYVFDHYEYSLTHEGTYIQTTLPLTLKDINGIKDGDTVYIKAVFSLEKVNVIAFANGGKIDSQDYKTLKVDYNTVWSTIKSQFTPQAPSGKTFSKWVDGNGNDVADNTQITDTFYVVAEYTGA